MSLTDKVHSFKKTQTQNNPLTEEKECHATLTFDELIIGGCLSRIEVKVYAKGKPLLTPRADELLIELQCEV